jgi:hypothetical protein
MRGSPQTPRQAQRETGAVQDRLDRPGASKPEGLSLVLGGQPFRSNLSTGGRIGDRQATPAAGMSRTERAEKKVLRVSDGEEMMI